MDRRTRRSDCGSAEAGKRRCRLPALHSFCRGSGGSRSRLGGYRSGPAGKTRWCSWDSRNRGMPPTSRVGGTSTICTCAGSSVQTRSPSGCSRGTGTTFPLSVSIRQPASGAPWPFSCHESREAEGSGYQQNLQNIGVVLADLNRIGKALGGRYFRRTWPPGAIGYAGDLSGVLRPVASEETAGFGGSRTWGIFRRPICCWSSSPKRVLVALNPYVAKNGPGFTARAVETIRRLLPPGIHETSWSYAPDTAGPIQPGYALFGREIALEAALNMSSLRDAVVETASALKPAFEAIQALGAGPEGAESGPAGPEQTLSRKSSPGSRRQVPHRSPLPNSFGRAPGD